jgi:hypothetical protein
MNHLMKACCYVVLTVATSACAPDRAQWMAKATNDQAHLLTQDIGQVDQVRQQAGGGARTLLALATSAASITSGPNAAPAKQFTADATNLAAGLQSIAATQSDGDFANACLGMCTDSRKKAAAAVGPLLVALANQPGESQLAIFGSRLSAIPDKCEQAERALAEASTQEQIAEVNHQTNVNRALIAAGVLFVGVAAVEAASAGRTVIQQPAPAPVLHSTTSTNCNVYGDTLHCTSY